MVLRVSGLEPYLMPNQEEDSMLDHPLLYLLLVGLVATAPCWASGLAYCLMYPWRGARSVRPGRWVHRWWGVPSALYPRNYPRVTYLRGPPRANGHEVPPVPPPGPRL